MTLNPFTLFGLFGSRAEETHEPRSNGNGWARRSRTSTRATFLTRREQETVDDTCDLSETEAERVQREEREAAQAQLGSTTAQINERLDELLARQAPEV